MKPNLTVVAWYDHGAPGRVTVDIDAAPIDHRRTLSPLRARILASELIEAALFAEADAITIVDEPISLAKEMVPEGVEAGRCDARMMFRGEPVRCDHTIGHEGCHSNRTILGWWT